MENQRSGDGGFQVERRPQRLLLFRTDSLDEVASGQLDRFGFLDPDNGGRVRSATLGAYYRKEWESGDIFKLDGFTSRSLFDHYINFTFFLNDEENGDEILQHDSRLMEGVNTQYLHPYKLFGQRALFLAGANFHDNQINVSLSRAISRNPFELTTKANAHVTNGAGYVQQGIDFLNGRLHLDGGLRIDYFRFDLKDRVDPLPERHPGHRPLAAQSQSGLYAHAQASLDAPFQLRPRDCQPGCSWCGAEARLTARLHHRFLSDRSVAQSEPVLFEQRPVLD